MGNQKIFDSLQRMISNHPYQNQIAAIATIHHKDEAIGPILKKYLGLNLICVDEFNTDLLGTFTGELPREMNMLETAKEKAKQAINFSNAFIGIGSEGSFGPHPYIPFLASGLEILALIDSSTNNEVIVSHHFDTNYDNLITDPNENFIPFLNKIGFPEHSVIVKPEILSEKNQLIKGINIFDELVTAIKYLSAQSQTGRVCIQTDMRAHLNPTRMRNLGILAKKLALRLSRLCPHCNAPGFGISSVEKGLLCEECHSPTSLIKAEIYTCKLCGFSQRRHERNPNARANARWCDICNP